MFDNIAFAEIRQAPHANNNERTLQNPSSKISGAVHHNPMAQALDAMLAAKGLESTDERACADLVVLNTCTDEQRAPLELAAFLGVIFQPSIPA